MSGPRFSTIVRPTIVLVLVALVTVAYVQKWHEALNLDTLRSQHSMLMALYNHSPAQTIALFVGLYILVATLALPGASILSLGAGAIFGFWPALVLVSFASTAGATVAFWLARYLARDFITARFPGPLQRINEGLQREGIWYLMTLRLIPAFPFFLINGLMGLTTIRTRTYFWVSQLGMLPATIVIVNAGHQLAGLTSMREIFSLPLLLSFAAIGLLPLAISKALRLWRKHPA